METIHRKCRLSRAQSSVRRRSGFTLVEMLVAVALVLVAMLLFAQVFQTATASLSKQKGLAENDQKARLLTTIVRGDLEKRTFRDVVPFTNALNTMPLGGALFRRSGYFYVAENDPGDDTDDVLQFTAMTSAGNVSVDTTPFGGKALDFGATILPIASETAPNVISAAPTASVTAASLANLTHIWISGSVDAAGNSNDGRYTLASAPVANGGTGNIDFTIDSSQSISTMVTHGNICVSEYQPEIDDGILGNTGAMSPAAEISYFLRGGNLYRRVLLIRNADPDTVQPQFANGTSLIGTDYLPAADAQGNVHSLWGDFDFSAFYFRGQVDTKSPSPLPTIQQGPRFHSVANSLSNASNEPSQTFFYDSTGAAVPAQLQTDASKIISLGMPQFRFGHDPWTGIPCEFTDRGAATGDFSSFIGRFTLWECSNPNFLYPGAGSANVTALSPWQDASPVSTSTTSPTLTFDANRNVSNYATATSRVRRGEDILMTNVISFDVKVWDSQSSPPAFFDLGDSTSFSFTPALVQNGFYCPPPMPGPSPPKTYPRYRYDTWHPSAAIIQPGDPGAGNVPARNTSPPFDPRVGNVSTNAQIPLAAIQITINYRDVSSDSNRQLTIVQSLTEPH